jgi:hypothetical protein
MMVENSLDAIHDIQVEEQVNYFSSSLEHCEWYSDLIYYLKNLSCPSNFNKTQRRSLQLWACGYSNQMEDDPLHPWTKF